MVDYMNYDYLNEKYLKLDAGIYISDNYIIKSYGKGLLILNKNDWKTYKKNKCNEIDKAGYYTLHIAKKKYKIISYIKERKETLKKLKRRRRKGIKINVSDIINNDDYILCVRWADYKYKWIDKEKERAKIDIDENGNITAYISEFSEIWKEKGEGKETIFKGSQSDELEDYPQRLEKESILKYTYYF